MPNVHSAGIYLYREQRADTGPGAGVRPARAGRRGDRLSRHAACYPQGKLHLVTFGNPMGGSARVETLAVPYPADLD